MFEESRIEQGTSSLPANVQIHVLYCKMRELQGDPRPKQRFLQAIKQEKQRRKSHLN